MCGDSTSKRHCSRETVCRMIFMFHLVRARARARARARVRVRVRVRVRARI